MKILFLDFETSDTANKKNRRDPSPFLPDNFIVSYGWSTHGYEQDSSGYRFLRHRDFNGSAAQAVALLQSLLDECELLVAFNAKFELEWLLEAGFKYNRQVYCPMVVEYILARALSVDLDLDSCCGRRNTIRKLGSLIDDLWDSGSSFFDIPIPTVEEYGIRDVQCARELYFVHQGLLKEEDNKSLIPTIQMSNEFIWCLVDMERNGVFIDADALEKVENDFKKEYALLRTDLEKLSAGVLGDIPINLDSPEQLSWLIYSRKVNDKHAWKETFNLGTNARGKRNKPRRLSTKDFLDTIKRQTTLIEFSNSQHCRTCDGKGRIHTALTKSGREYKNPPKCSYCGGKGYILVGAGRCAGFRLAPRGSIDVAAGGFATDKDTLEQLAERLRGLAAPSALQLAAREFLEKFIKYNAIGTYLSTFVEGIKRGRNDKSILHTKLMQCITRTGRLSSQDPNFQNMPRALTFPVRKVVSSRFREDGGILEVDFAKLEYVVAVFLAQDRAGMEDLKNGVDAHNLTAKILTEAGQSTSRQEAKPRTFRPLYRGTTGTTAEIAYNKWFMEKHYGIEAWHQKLIKEVLDTGGYTTLTGRQFIFPFTKRLLNGYVTNSTQIANYAVQATATADFLPCVCIDAWKRLRHLKSRMILEVHDSFVIDYHKSELNLIIEIINSSFKRLPEILKERYNINLNVEIGWELKYGQNWLAMKQAA
jgi:DNA polymerase I-like protein with 3'-5' exonuclease and polymerase domains